MLKRLLCVLLSMLLLCSAVGCGSEEVKEGEYQIYYTNMDRTKLVAEAYDSTGFSGEDLVQELLGRLKSAPDSLQLRQTIPADVMINGIKMNGVYLYIDFSEEYKKMKPTEEILVRAAIVKTVLQAGNFSLVSFTINSEPLLNPDGTIVGNMSADSFVENPGQQINTSVEATLNLYFSSGEGTKLVKETRNVHYSTNISMEKLIMEQLIEGPTRSSLMATIPSNTKLLSVSVVEGVCYVNLNDAFLNQNTEVNEEIVLYSIVNSLTELPGITKVQLSINGDTKGNVRYTYPIAKMYERNLDVLESK